METVDFTKQHRELYRASAKKPSIVNVPKLKYLMIDGAGYPGASAEFQPAIEALMAAAYTIKFTFKKSDTPKDFKVIGPEGVWWTENDAPWDPARTEDWRWTLIAVVPDFVNAAALRSAKAALVAKGKDLPALAKARLESWKEGPAAQLMHIGPYDAETETITRLTAFVEESGYAINGRHHEIYISDPRRVAAEKLKTIIRYPVKKAR